MGSIMMKEKENNASQYISSNGKNCEVNLASASADRCGHMLENPQIQKSTSVTKPCSQQVCCNSPTRTSNKHGVYLTDCDKRNSSASLDSGRDSTYATGSEGSSGVQYPQTYLDDGCLLSTTSSCCYSNQTSKSDILSGRKINHNSSGRASFDHTLLPVATMPQFYNHTSSTTHNVNSSNHSSSSNGGNGRCGVNGSSTNLAYQQLCHQQSNKDDTLTSPVHKYNSNSIGNTAINVGVLSSISSITEPYEYHNFPSYHYSAVNHSKLQQQQKPLLSAYSPCQERNCTGFDCVQTRIPVTAITQQQFPSGVQQYYRQQQSYREMCQPYQQHLPIHSVMINPDDEALFAWLRSVGLSRLSGCLSKAGFDLWTLCHTTPEELNACGITNPYDRQILRNELVNLQLSDPITEQQLPTSVQDLMIQLHLQQYWPKLHDQGFITFEQVVRITWDDLEEIGILKLGHQKKFIIAIRKLNRLIHDRVFLSTGCDQVVKTSPPINKSFCHIVKDGACSKSSSSYPLIRQQCQASEVIPSVVLMKCNADGQHLSKHNISEIGTQVESDLVKSSSPPSSPFSYSSTSDISSRESPYSLPPPIGFQDSPPSSSSTFPTSAVILDSEERSFDLPQVYSSCITNEQILSNSSSHSRLSLSNVQLITDMNDYSSSSNTLLNENTNPPSAFQYSHQSHQQQQGDKGNKFEHSGVFQRRSSNPTLYSLKSNDTVQNTTELSKWSSGFLTSPQLRLPINVNSTSDPDLEAMYNIQAMLDQISERLILSDK
ncbi:unnamed protein product [Heterobilharzia americana]|nr:unnamed protein product [Heterobilharzia americana]